MCFVGGNANSATVMENSMKSPQKLKKELLFESANLFLDIYTTQFKSGSQRDICPPVWAKRSYARFKVRRGGREKIPLIQGKEQQLCFVGAAVKR